MKLKTVSALLAGSLALTACGGFEYDNSTIDKSRDLGRDSKDLSQLVAGIWVDPNGCDHWIIDDGIEGYLSARLDPSGKPVCTGHGAETVAYGPYKSGTDVNPGTETSGDGTGAAVN